MPTYNVKCTKCKKKFDKTISFSEYDEVNLGDGSLVIKCDFCENLKLKIVYDECPHSHVINTNNIGVYAEKNTKRVGKTKIEEVEAKKKEELAPRGEKGWYGRLSPDKYKEIYKSRKSKKEQQKIASDYILKGK